MASLLVLLLIAVIVLLLVIFIARAMRPSDTVGPSAIPGQPGCGGCGYPTKGLSELICPECGADLRKVGIVKPGEGRLNLAGCILPLLTTVMVFLLAILGYGLAEQVVPTYREYDIQFDLISVTDEYYEVLVDTECTIIVPPNSTHWGSALSLSTQYGPPNVTSITLGDPGSKVRVNTLALQIMPNPSSNTTGTLTYTPPFEIDPATRIATWTDAQNNKRISQGPVTDADVLALLGTAGANTGDPQVISDAQQIHTLIDGLLNGTNQFKLQGFDSGGYGAGGSSHLGPVWFLPVYAGAWFVIWIVVMIYLARRGRKKASPTQ